MDSGHTFAFRLASPLRNHASLLDGAAKMTGEWPDEGWRRPAGFIISVDVLAGRSILYGNNGCSPMAV